MSGRHRVVVVAIALGLCGLGSPKLDGLGGLGGQPAHAQEPGEPAVPASPTPYVVAGSEYAFATVEAPLPARQLGAIAVASLARVRGSTTPVPAVTGDASLAPPNWPDSLPAERTSVGKAPFAANQEDGSCRCATGLGYPAERRVAALYATTTFQVGDELARVRLLRLRVRYQDGVIAFINGREVARRNLPPDADPLDVAERPHGPEWETFYIPAIPGLLSEGDNVLAIEIRPSGRRLTPVLDAELWPSFQEAIVRGPMVQRVAENAATVVFETDQPLKGRVEYGPTQELGLVAHSAGGGLAYRHAIELRDLPAGKPVHYRVVAGQAVSDAMVFHTAPSAREVLRFAVYGDTRGGHDVHQRIARAILAEAPDMVLVTGDLVMRGSDEADWQRYFEVTAELQGRVPVYPAVGNHDVGRSGDQRLRMNEIFYLWPGPNDRPDWGHWYSFDVANVHFTMLDTNALDSEKQLAWLEQDLADARSRGVRAIFAMGHHSPYSRGPHGGSKLLVSKFVPLLARYGVSMTFSGHDHLYQRGEINGFRYIVSGGGGAPLYSIRCGVRRKRRCKVKDGMQHVVKEHHYIMLSVFQTHVAVCPKRPDSSPLEPCINLPLRKGR